MLAWRKILRNWVYSDPYMLLYIKTLSLARALFVLKKPTYFNSDPLLHLARGTFVIQQNVIRIGSHKR